jgi:hypothetical protein
MVDKADQRRHTETALKEAGAPASLEREIEFAVVCSDMIAAGFRAEDQADTEGVSRADRISRIYAAMDAERSRLESQRSGEAQLIALQSPPLSPEASQRTGPSWTVPVFRERGRCTS